MLTISAKENSLKNVKLDSQLVFHTNVSQVSIPVLSYNGKLTKVFRISYFRRNFLNIFFLKFRSFLLGLKI